LSLWGSTASDWELAPELLDFPVAQATNQTGKPGICIQMKVRWAKDDVRFALPEELTG
jgi:hypothetical protein